MASVRRSYLCLTRTITQQVRTPEHTSLLCIRVQQLKGLVKSVGLSILLNSGEKRSGAAISPGKTRYRLFWDPSISSRRCCTPLISCQPGRKQRIPPEIEQELRTSDLEIQALFPSWRHRNCFCCTEGTPIIPPSPQQPLAQETQRKAGPWSVMPPASWSLRKPASYLLWTNDRQSHYGKSDPGEHSSRLHTCYAVSASVSSLGQGFKARKKPGYL